MDDPKNKPKDEAPNLAEMPETIDDPVGPPPDPRGKSESSDKLDQDLSADIAALEKSKNQADDPEDGEQDESEPETQAPDMQINPPKSRFKRFITSKKLWLGLSVFIVVAALLLWFIKETRVWIVNAVGLKVPVAVTTRTVAEAGRPSALLQKATVSLNGTKVESDEAGQAKFTAEYGQANIMAEKTGYESASYSDYYDFDPFFGLTGGTPNDQERTAELQLKSVGLPLTFKVIDWLTQQPVTNGEFTVGEVVAKPDENGLVSVKVPPTDANTVKVSSKVGGYVDKEMELSINVETLQIQQDVLVPSGKSYFISKRTGNLGIYSSDLDGGNVQQVVAPSANETASVDFAVSPNGKYGILASTREGKRDASNNLLQKLYVVNLENGNMTSVDEGLWFDFKDWSGDTLVYTAASVSTSQRLGSVDASANKKADLAAAVSYGQVRVSLGNAIYLANVPDSENNPELRVVPAAGGTEKSLGGKIKALTQTDYDKVAYRGSDNVWHEYNLNTSKAGNAAAPASTNRAFLAANSADGQNRLFVDKVDGVNTLFIKNIATGQETKLYGNAGLSRQTHWVGNMVLFRIADATQTTDNVIVAAAKAPKKVGDVTASSSPQSTDYFSFY